MGSLSFGELRGAGRGRTCTAPPVLQRYRSRRQRLPEHASRLQSCLFEDLCPEIVNGRPVVQNELWVFDIDPVSAVAHF
jgi:hypothetical protein